MLQIFTSSILISKYTNTGYSEKYESYLNFYKWRNRTAEKERQSDHNSLSELGFKEMLKLLNKPRSKSGGEPLGVENGKVYF